MVLANSQGCLSIGSGVMTRVRLDPGLQARSDGGKVDSDFASPDSRNGSSARNILGRRGRFCGRASRLLRPPPHSLCLLRSTRSTATADLDSPLPPRYRSRATRTECHQDGRSPSSLNFGVPRAPSARCREGVDDCDRRSLPAFAMSPRADGIGVILHLDVRLAELGKPVLHGPFRAFRALSWELEGSPSAGITQGGQ